jgi:site-specific DNA-methyltransferase (adenine-specific)
MILNIINAECVAELSKMGDNSVGSFICDPPYGLRFMDREFDDRGQCGREQIEWHKQWLVQAYRVLKPNGVIKAFSSSRTQFYLVKAMYEIGLKDITIDVWYYLNGFPKAVDISKEFDRIEGNEREIIGWKWSAPKGVINAEDRGNIGAGSFGGEKKQIPITKPCGDNAKQWDGWYSALKPSYEPIIIGYKR